MNRQVFFIRRNENKDRDSNPVFFIIQLQADKDGEHKKREWYQEKQQLEKYCFLEPFSEADACKSYSDKQRSAGRIQDVRIAVGEKVS